MASASIQCLGVCFDDIQAVVFDKDGTLAQVESYLKGLGQHRADGIAAFASDARAPLLKSFGVTPQGLNPAGALAVASRYENKITAATYLTAQGYDWIQALDMATMAFAEADRCLIPKAAKTPLVAGGAALLAQLKDASIKLGLLSADSQANVEDFARYYQLETVFDYLQGTTPGNPSKTEPRFFEAACQAMRVRPHNILVIGDSGADLRMAEVGNAAGFIGFMGAWQMPKAIAGADLLIDRYSLISVR